MSSLEHVSTERACDEERYCCCYCRMISYVVYDTSHSASCLFDCSIRVQPDMSSFQCAMPCLLTNQAIKQSGDLCVPAGAPPHRTCARPGDQRAH